MNIETLAIHAENHPDPSTGAVTPPIHLSTTFARSIDGDYLGDFSYSRSGNPNRSSLERALAALEGGEVAYTYSSGMAAISAVLQTLKPGEHVIAPTDIYHGARQLLQRMERWGVKIDYIDLYKLDILEATLKSNTAIVFIETPSNPLLKITDIAGVVARAKPFGARVVVDNTWATPVLQRPLEMGADITVHSSSKYFGGHSDVLGGAVILRDKEMYKDAFASIQLDLGAVPSPFDCWLIRRGLMTLPLRVREQSKTAATIASFLEVQPSIERVFYPGLESHPGHEIAKKQMQMYGAMLSILVKGGEAAAQKVIANVKLFTRATSLGAVESLIEHRYRSEGEDTLTPRNLVRISIGLEHPDDLMMDLEQALR
ncbi:MAG: cystathionine gamma-synthase [Zhongshania sp.]|jgi:cystathionine gamma-synthase